MNVCVFCGSSSGAHPHYADAARQLGSELAARNMGLVYGGASVGLMGTIADAALAAGGKVTGVIPQSIVDYEIAHEQLSELHIVQSMHERKALMEELSDLFIALPGGFGTLDETFEILTWAQLSLHRKPIGLLNIDGYYDGLLQFADHQVKEGFVRAEHCAMLHSDSEAAALIDRLLNYQVPESDKWVLG